MQNTRPNHNFNLPLVNGTDISCTVKQPKQKLKAEVQKLVVAQQMCVEEFSALYRSTDKANGIIADAIAAGDTAAEAAARAHLATVLARMDTLRDEQLAIGVAQVQAITNYPNADDGTQRTEADIDWDSIDPDEVNGALSFFLNGQKK